MNAALLTSVFGSGVRLRPAKDAFESQYGVMVEFLDEDGSIRDFEGLERVDALMAALYLSTLATEGLSDVAELSGLYHDAFQRLDGCAISPGLIPANIIPFPASSEAQPPKTISEEDPTGGTPVHPVPPVGIVGQLTVDSGQLTADTPPAPPSSFGGSSTAGGKDRGLADARAGRLGWASQLEYGKPSGDPAL